MTTSTGNPREWLRLPTIGRDAERSKAFTGPHGTGIGC